MQMNDTTYPTAIEIITKLANVCDFVLWAEESKPYLLQLQTLATKYLDELSEFSIPGEHKLAGICRLVETVLKTKRLTYNKSLQSTQEDG